MHRVPKYGMIRPRQKIASPSVSYTFFSDISKDGFVICLDLIQTETERIRWDCYRFHLHYGYLSLRHLSVCAGRCFFILLPQILIGRFFC